MSLTDRGLTDRALTDRSLTRRQMMTGAAALAAAGLPSASPAAGGVSGTAVVSLGKIAAERGVLFGTAFDTPVLDKPGHAALYLHHARILAPDYSLKIAQMRPQEGPADFTAADRLVDFATQNGLPLRGHTLVWNEHNPPWVAKLSASRAAYWMDRHIDEVVGRYAGRIAMWDVVNEPLWPDHGNKGYFRNGPWYAAMGGGYVLRALKRARAADPGLRIAINESGPEWEDHFGPTPRWRSGLLQLVDEVQQAGVTLDCVGLQGHWFPKFRFDAERFKAYLAELASRNVAIHITEMDVNDGIVPGDFAARDAEVARRYRAFITAALSQPRVEAILTWQLCDDMSWLMNEPKAWERGGQRPRPLPFDEYQRPKAAYHAIAAALSPPR